VSRELKDVLANAVASATKLFVRAKRRAAAADESDYLSDRQIERLRRRHEQDNVIKPAAYKVMPQAYDLASAHGTLPANARQIMYAARSLVLAETGGTCWKDSDYFTQALLPDYMFDYPSETANWDVVYDARGHLVEPHVRMRLGLGTVDVRKYVASWRDGNTAKDLQVDIDEMYPTKGPNHRYRFALFLEKEGFDALLERSQIAERYDLAIFSSKGMSTIATRQLVDELSQVGVTILIMHDFDVSGLSIAHTLGHDTRRYKFRVEPTVIDLGLRLVDVEKMHLQTEPVELDQIKHPGQKLLDYGGVTRDEIDFLIEGQVDYKKWRGKRVELNAMTSGQFVRWLEEKLDEHCVTKVIPDKKTLEDAWRRAQVLAKVKAAVAKIKTEPNTKLMPADLSKRLRKMLDDEPALSWDQALVRIAGRRL
jgi:hypothetical protein